MMDAVTAYLVGTVKTLMLHTIKYSYGTPVFMAPIMWIEERYKRKYIFGLWVRAEPVE
jgi:hypothetical protein